MRSRFNTQYHLALEHYHKYLLKIEYHQGCPITKILVTIANNKNIKIEIKVLINKIDFQHMIILMLSTYQEHEEITQVYSTLTSGELEGWSGVTSLPFIAAFSVTLAEKSVQMMR